MLSHLATWFTTGAKLVGPYSCTVLRLWWYASKIPSIPLQYGFSMLPFWKKRQLQWKSISWTWWMHLSNKETQRSLSKPAVYIKPCTHKQNKLEIKFTAVQVGSQKHEKMITKWKKGRLTSPVETHVTPVHQEAVWLQSPERGTSCHCRSPEWSPQQPSVPWRRRSAGRGSCSATKLTVTGYLLTKSIWRSVRVMRDKEGTFTMQDDTKK